MKTFPITQPGYKALEEKLKKLRTEFETLPKLIAAARAKGDLKENAEYHAARERQGFLRALINQVSFELQTSRVIDPKALPAAVVTFGKWIEVENLDTQETSRYFVVGPAETEFHQNAISVTSHLVRGLLGKRAAQQVTVEVPAGKQNYLIKKISF